MESGFDVRWFKHISQSNNDEKLANLLFRSNGLELYGFYWLTIEIIATDLGIENQTWKEYPTKKWASFSGVSTRKFRNYAETLAKLELFSVKLSENSVRIDCPNILKYRDEYSRKKAKTNDPVKAENDLTNSGQGQDGVAPDTEANTDTKREGKQKNGPAEKISSSDISKFYSMFYNTVDQPAKKEIKLIERYIAERPLSFWKPFIRNMRRSVDGGGKLPSLAFFDIDYKKYESGEKPKKRYFYKCPKCKDDKGVVSPFNNLSSVCRSPSHKGKLVDREIMEIKND